MWSGSEEESGDGFFPFCSQRCKLLDLGKWLDGNYSISAEQRGEAEEDEE